MKTPKVLTHPFAKALILHAGVGLLLFSHLLFPAKDVVIKPHINVSLVKGSGLKKPSPAKPKPELPKEEPKKEEPKKEVKPPEQEKIQQEQKKIEQEQLILKKKQQEKEQLEKKKLAEEQAKKDKAQKEEEKKKKDLEEKKKLEKKRAEDLVKLKKKEAERLKELEKLRAQENEEMEEADSSEVNDEVGQYIGAIKEQVQRTWSRPPSARRGMQVTLKIQLMPNGEVVSVSIEESSGNAAFDRSAEQAVNRAGKLPVPNDRKLFDRHFRSLELIFRPEDL